MPHRDPEARRASNLKAQHKRRGKLSEPIVRPELVAEPVATVAADLVATAAPVATPLELAALDALRARGPRGADRSTLARLTRERRSWTLQQAVDVLIARGLVEPIPRRVRAWRAVAAAA